MTPATPLLSTLTLLPAVFAAAFFLLGGSLKDAVSVCIRQLDDFQLAIALARTYEGGDDGPVLRSLLEETVVPLAFAKGYRWLGSWALWMLGRRDLAVQIIVVRPSFPSSPFQLTPRSQTPLSDLATRLPYKLPVVSSPAREDPALVFLFAQLRSWSLQTVKGAIAVPGQTEFNVSRAYISTAMQRAHDLSLRSLSCTSRASCAAWVSPPSSLLADAISPCHLLYRLPRSRSQPPAHLAIRAALCLCRPLSTFSPRRPHSPALSPPQLNQTRHLTPAIQHAQPGRLSRAGRSGGRRRGGTGEAAEAVQGGRQDGEGRGEGSRRVLLRRLQLLESVSRCQRCCNEYRRPTPCPRPLLLLVPLHLSPPFRFPTVQTDSKAADTCLRRCPCCCSRIQ